MKKTIDVEVIDLGLRPYAEVWKLQKEIFQQMVQQKLDGTAELIKNRFILCEHPPVYTLGKHGKESNILAVPEKKGAEFFHIERGGDITYHGPGQLVGYPLFDLEQFDRSLSDYICKMEECILRTVKGYGLNVGRIKGANGIWVDPEEEILSRKIAALGVRSSRWVTMHGFALNVSTDLSFFDHIIPCGLDNRRVTSLQKEGIDVQMSQVISDVLANFEQVFGLKFQYAQSNA